MLTKTLSLKLVGHENLTASSVAANPLPVVADVQSWLYAALLVVLLGAIICS